MCPFAAERWIANPEGARVYHVIGQYNFMVFPYIAYGWPVHCDRNRRSSSAGLGRNARCGPGYGVQR
jgi:hypothetical protein